VVKYKKIEKTKILEFIKDLTENYRVFGPVKKILGLFFQLYQVY